MQDLVLVDRPTAVDLSTLYVPPTEIQRRGMQEVSAAVLKQVIRNAPMPTIPRQWDQAAEIDIEAVTHRLLDQMCTDTPYLDEGLPRDASEEIAREFLDRIVREHRTMGLTAQADRVDRELRRFVNIRYGLPEALQFMDREKLLRPDSVIPVMYLPDLFMAVPVCYFRTTTTTPGKRRNEVAAAVDQICGLIPNQRFADTFQMFNRRRRTLEDYKGDLIPARIMRRMLAAAPVFDILFIMTPYLDEVASEWDAANWARSVDPYLVGIKKDVPAIFVLARFSESGVFPLYNELLAGTIEFLRKHAEKVKKLDGGNYEWYRAASNGEPGGRQNTWQRTLGTQLFGHSQKLLEAFKQGHLFPWLRGDAELATSA